MAPRPQYSLHYDNDEETPEELTAFLGKPIIAQQEATRHDESTRIMAPVRRHRQCPTISLAVSLAVFMSFLFSSGHDNNSPVVSTTTTTTTTTTTSSSLTPLLPQQQQEEEPLDHPTYCIWGPADNETIACQEAIKATACRRRRRNGREQGNRIPRLLYLGDSTTHQAYEFSYIRQAYAEHKKDALQATGVFTCNHYWRLDFGKDRCHINEQVGLDYPDTWTPPGEMEGPAMFGLENPHCQDKRGGLGDFIDCKPTKPDLESWVSTLNQEEKENLIYSGFLGVEFARDVELQTPQFLTTQENVANLLLRDRWNTKEMLQVFEKPTCIINTGHHDVIIANMTKEAYVANVQWYLHLLAEQCETIFWSATTAPEGDGRPQKIKATREWGLAVRDMLNSDAVLRHKTLYVDGYVASLSYPHMDNGKCVLSCV